jgi:hypothetical protein
VRCLTVLRHVQPQRTPAFHSPNFLDGASALLSTTVDLQLEAIRIVTPCTSREQFIAMFSRYCTATSCFIPSSETRPIGTATVFSIRLADGTLLLRGEGVVLDSWSHGNHRFRRPGLHLGIHRLDDDCGELFAMLVVEPSTTAVPIPPKTQLQMLLAAAPSVVSEVETPTIEMPPLALPEEPRVPGSPFILPANPLTDMNDDLVAAFVECNLVAELGVAAVVVTDNAQVAISYSAPVSVPLTDSARIAGLPMPAVPTVKTPRDVIATLLGVAPLPKPIGPIGFAALPRPVPSPAREKSFAMFRPARPRQRLELSQVAPVTMVTRRRSVVHRIALAVVNRVRRWWLPATVATTLLATTMVLIP